MKQRIEVFPVEYATECDEINGDAYETWIEFLDWHIVIAIKDGEDSVAEEEITIIKKQGGAVTADFFAYSDNKHELIKPTGMNLYQVMNLLLTNYKRIHDEVFVEEGSDK